MQTALKILVIVCIIFLMICIRMFEGELFYDPLLQFFKTNHTTQSLPDMHFGKLMAATSFRFILNTTLSLGIIWVVYKSRAVVKVSIILYAILFVILVLCFISLLQYSTEAPHRMLFYVRRFLIQPLFLLILLPAFYFQGLKRR